MKRIVFVFLLLGLSACGEAGQVKKFEAVVKERLIDPDSAKFGEHFISKDGARACINVNSKNQFGGYVGEKPFFLFKSDDGREWMALGPSDLGPVVSLTCSQSLVDSLGKTEAK